MLAGILLLTAAITMFFGWSYSLTSQLTPLSTFVAVPPEEFKAGLSESGVSGQEFQPQPFQVPGPTAGIVESAKLLLDGFSSLLDKTASALDKYLSEMTSE